LEILGYQGFIGIDVGGKEELKTQFDAMYIKSKSYLENLKKLTRD